MLDTSFIDDCYYRNRFKNISSSAFMHNNLNSIFDTESTNIYSIESIDSKKIYNYKNRVLACFQTRPNLLT